MVHIQIAKEYNGLWERSEHTIVAGEQTGKTYHTLGVRRGKTADLR